MKRHDIKILVPGIIAAAVLALAVGAGAQTPPTAPTAPTATSPEAAPMTGHHHDCAAEAKREADMKAECEAMMAKRQEMQDKLKAMDATLDTLVAEMNAAKDSKEPDAMEKPMAAVINELVAQQKASRSMRMEMQPAMMAHMAHHMKMHDTQGGMKCPMMKMDKAPAPDCGQEKPKS